NTANVEGVQRNRDDEALKRPSLAITSKQLDYWRRKSDEELKRAATSLDNYKEEGRQAILAELARRSIEPIAEDQNEEVSPLTFCYHCGSDVPVAARTCGACGKSL
ncbi:MAG TPA: zinc ribbon domain-containing protein, partial [Gemmatimonadaceae bacterium]|nr:zinc ribbon domain-containing protein [Gemmatimonadaceae bacterium]